MSQSLSATISLRSPVEALVGSCSSLARPAHSLCLAKMASGTSIGRYPFSENPNPLKVALIHTPDFRLRQVILQACKDRETTYQHLWSLLLVEEPTTSPPVTSLEEHHATLNNEDSGSKSERASGKDDKAPKTTELPRDLKRKRLEDDDGKVKSPAIDTPDLRAVFYPATTNSQGAKKQCVQEPPKPRYLIYDNCDNEYDVTVNVDEKCRYHNGHKELNNGADFWDAYDDDEYHGDRESFEDDPEFAEGFSWDCCMSAGDEEGCTKDKHRHYLDV